MTNPFPVLLPMSGPAIGLANAEIHPLIEAMTGAGEVRAAHAIAGESSPLSQSFEYDWDVSPDAISYARHAGSKPRETTPSSPSEKRPLAFVSDTRLNVEGVLLDGVVVSIHVDLELLRRLEAARAEASVKYGPTHTAVEGGVFLYRNLGNAV